MSGNKRAVISAEQMVLALVKAEERARKTAHDTKFPSECKAFLRIADQLRTHRLYFEDTADEGELHGMLLILFELQDQLVNPGDWE